MPRYNPNVIEPKWQKFWDEHRTFQTPEMPAGEKLYVLDMFPYPSGDGLHVGHPEGYTATDIACRFARMRGKSVLHPMGFDAFGLPAEEHAIKTGVHPRVNTEENIATFRRQLKSLGFSYDWDRELATTDVEYVRWTQFIFLVLFDTWFDVEQQKGRPISELSIPEGVRAAGDRAIREYQDDHRLAYQSDAPVNWCPALGTVLANEEVIDGRSERGGHPVVRMPLRQWMLRITAYADRLEKDLESLDWSEGIKALQRNWIGRSTGAEVDFFIGCRPSAVGYRPEAANTTADSRQPTAESFDTWKVARAKCGYPRKPGEDVLRIYTTRPDTLFGATYMVIAPEHPFVERLTTAEQASAVKGYCEGAARKSDRERQEEGKKKTGVFTGSHAINPANGEAIPIWIADYVLISYGTGAIMAVPAHDERDFEFAKSFDLPIRVVVLQPGTENFDAEFQATYHSHYASDDFVYLVHNRPKKATNEEEIRQSISNCGATANDVDIKIRDDGSFYLFIRRFPRCDEIDSWLVPESDLIEVGTVFTGNGLAINSGNYDGLSTAEFKQKIAADLESAGLGRAAVNYKLRDWLFSRQRFWGEPFPILHELDDDGKPTGAVRAVDVADLPVDLPHLEDFKPPGTPEPPLSKAPDDWLYVEIDGNRYRRETNTMPQWAGSCWYYLRFIDPKNDKALIDPKKEKAWMPVDLYIGGAEHAVLHLLYARFWHKVLFDRGYVSTVEPFAKLVNQGMILGENNEKMSKSRGNVVNPDDVVREYGADALRLFEMFMGPLEATKPWSTAGVSGVRGFLDRAWRLIIDANAEEMALNAAVQDVEPTVEQNRVLHKTIGAVTKDLETMSFNTAIARMMEFTNFFTRESVRPRACMEPLVLLLAPYAPHIAEELWAALGHGDTLAYEPWPKFDAALAKDDLIEIPVQIQGKLRAKINVSPDASAEELEQAALADSKIQELLADKQIVKKIVVPGRLVNFVVR